MRTEQISWAERVVAYGCDEGGPEHLLRAHEVLAQPCDLAIRGEGAVVLGALGTGAGGVVEGLKQAQHLPCAAHASFQLRNDQSSGLA